MHLNKNLILGGLWDSHDINESIATYTMIGETAEDSHRLAGNFLYTFAK